MTKDPSRRNKGAVSENLVLFFSDGCRIYIPLVGQNHEEMALLPTQL